MYFFCIFLYIYTALHAFVYALLYLVFNYILVGDGLFIMYIADTRVYYYY